MIQEFMYENITNISSSVDWKNMGVIAHVKDQRNCGEII